MSKCLGCGAVLQDTDEKKDGYVKNLDAKLCLRCFKIKNYGEYKPVIKNNDEFVNMLESINKTNDLVVVVCDLFNFNPDMELLNKYLHNDVILVLTKRDLLPKSLFEAKLLDYIKTTNLNIVDRVIVSSMNNYNFDSLFDKINSYKHTNNVYVVGYTNAGKSTLINKMLHNYATSDTVITTSLLPNTTIDKIELKINENLTLIDTPGILDNGSIYYLKDISELKRLIPKKAIKPRTYQIKQFESLMIEDLIRLDVKYNNVTFFFANNLDINRAYRNHDEPVMDKHIINVRPYEDIVISGLGFIKFTKKETVTLYTLKGINVYVRNSLV